MSKAKCSGACCKHVAQKLSPADWFGPDMPGSRFDELFGRVDESKRLGYLHSELSAIYEQYAEDVGRLLLGVVSGSSQRLVPVSSTDDACIFPKGLKALGKARPNGKLKSAVKKAKYDLA